MLISKARLGGVVFLLFCLSVMPVTAFAAKFEIKDGPTLDIYALGQFGFEQYDRESGKTDSLEFDTDRVRFGIKAKWDTWDGAFQFDANNTSGSNKTTLDSFIRDAFIRYRFSDAVQLKVGQYKTPVGMGYNLSGTRLPLIKRTMTSRLVLDRTIGAMLSGRNIGGGETGGFGYDLGVFNSADRSKAAVIDSAQEGDDYSYAARVVYDHGEMFHLQASYGEIENAAGVMGATCADASTPAVGFQASHVGCTAVNQVLDSEDYEVWDVGAIYRSGPVRLRAEYIDGENVDGMAEYGEQSWYVMGAYRFNDLVEGLVRYQEAKCDNCRGVPNDDRDLDRFEVGLSFFLGPNDRMGRLQLNYVSVSGDKEDYNGEAGGGDNRYNAILGQLQLYF